MASKETKPEGSIFSVTMDDTKNSSPSFGSSIKSHKTDDSCYSVSPSIKSKHELRSRTLILQAENHRYVQVPFLLVYNNFVYVTLIRSYLCIINT